MRNVRPKPSVLTRHIALSADVRRNNLLLKIYMKILILEGIATSGKTSVKNKLADAFVEKGINFSIIEEDETLMPILHNTDKQVGIDLLKKVIDNALKAEKDFIIFDRLFFTHIFRTKSSIEDFREIENLI